MLLRMAAFEHTLESSVRGHHVYKEVWTPILNECLQTRQDLGNAEDEFAVRVIKNDPASLNPELTVGHVRGNHQGYAGEITCEIIGSRRKSSLSQGGLQVPCLYKFIGKKKHIKKLRTLLLGHGEHNTYSNL